MEVELEAERGSVMERLKGVHDPRRREGRRYRLPGLIGMMVLAAVHGEGSLRGMWQWGCSQWERIAGPLDLWATKGPPAYATLWQLLAKMDAEELGQALGSAGSMGEEEAYSLDGKMLRGSRRATEPALQVVTAAGHSYHGILAQREVSAGDTVETAIGLLHAMPLEGKLVSLDAGLLQRSVVKTIEEKGGPTSGQ